MKKQLLIASSLIAGIAFGCGTTTTAIDPTNPEENNVLAVGTVSYRELTDATRAIVADAMISDDFQEFLTRYKLNPENANQRPLMMVWTLKNETGDNTFQTGLVTDEICTSLRNAGKVRVTLAAGKSGSTAAAATRDLVMDKNFNKKTVKERGTLNAPDLSLEGTVRGNYVNNGDATVRVFSFNLKIQDLGTGEEVWSYNKPVAVKKQ